MKNLLTIALLFITSVTLSQVIFTHATSKSNTNGHITNLSHPSVNGKSDAVLFITQVYGKYNNHQVGVWYNNGTWTIYNEDRIALPEGTKFNVLVLPAGDNVFTHTVDITNIQDTWTLIDHAMTNDNPNAIVFVTQNWKGSYNPKPIGVWYDGSKWSIFNQDNSKLPTGLTFNVLIQEEGYANSTGGYADVYTVTTTDKNNQWGDYLATMPIMNPNTFLIATQNWSTKGPYNVHIPALWWGGTVWTIYNQDRKTMNTDTKFNILAYPRF